MRNTEKLNILQKEGREKGREQEGKKDRKKERNKEVFELCGLDDIMK